VLIDWFTISAQVINFLVLVFLLHRFLYGPIVKAMDEREERIFAQLKEAELREQSAEAEAQQLRAARAALDTERRQLLQQAEQEAEARRKELVQQARREADELRHHWRAAVQQAREQFLGDLRQGTVRHVYAVARRALSDLADADIERQMIKVFLQRLAAMNAAEVAELLEAAADGDAVVVYSAFELASGDRQRIVAALQDVTAATLKVAFETRPRLVGGLELQSPSRRVAWNLAHYLRSLEAELSERLDLEAQEEHEPVPETVGPVAV
jgi:F-type H+-transporting ATPase subunit b